MQAWVLSAMLLSSAPGAEPFTVDTGKLTPDVRWTCSADSVIEPVELEEERTLSRVFFRTLNKRSVRLDSERVVMARKAGDHEELLLDVGGKYQRILRTRAEIGWVSESPDGNFVAAVVVRQRPETRRFRPSASSLYLFDTESWEGEELIDLFGFSGLVWSPDSTRLAVGDYARLRFFDLETKRQSEVCVIDSQTTQDANEWFNKLEWVDKKRIEIDYQYPLGEFPFQVKLP